VFAETRLKVSLDPPQQPGANLFTGMHRNDRDALAALDDDVRAALPQLKAPVALQDLEQ
jgi:hypothetical protein